MLAYVRRFNSGVVLLLLNVDRKMYLKKMNNKNRNHYGTKILVHICQCLWLICLGCAFQSFNNQNLISKSRPLTRTQNRKRNKTLFQETFNNKLEPINK